MSHAFPHQSIWRAVFLALAAHATAVYASIFVDHFPGMQLDDPLPAVFEIGEEVVLNGMLEDETLTQVLFRLSPVSKVDDGGGPFWTLATIETRRFFRPIENQVFLDGDKGSRYLGRHRPTQ